MRIFTIIIFSLCFSVRVFSQEPSQFKHMNLDKVLDKIPGSKGERFISAINHGTMNMLVYAPRGKDEQSPHNQDEVYIIVRGSGTFVCDTTKVVFRPNDALFVPAGKVHYFEKFTDDLVTWVVFYGAKGGER
jgi:mannose-6-phosphate isomerase-like protein (cupin superfamily)